jgi:hypothetical protein
VNGRTLGKLAALFGILLSTAAPMAAQDVAPLEVFGAFSFMNNDDFGGGSGWEASAGWNALTNVALVAGVSGHYGDEERSGGRVIVTNSSLYNFHVGPRFTSRIPDSSLALSGELFLGVSRLDIELPGGAEGDDTAVSWGFGVGLDYELNDTWAARLKVQLIRPKFFDDFENFPRVSLGMVYRWGGL